MSEEIVYGHITKTPGVCGGKVRIADHRIKVSHIVAEHEHLGLCPDEICDAHPGLTLGKVHAALAYYFDHMEEIRAEFEEEDKLEAEFKRQYPDGIRRS